MDLDAVADELYGLRPEDFVAARDRRAAEARGSGEPDLAKAIGALRRPSLAAWVSNLLVRRQSDEVRPLLALGEDLRRAHRDLDGPRLRRLAHQQREVIGALGRQARQLAAQAGHPVGEGVQREVEETLHAALADAGAAREWAAGRLVRPLSSAVGFPAADEGAMDRRTAPPASTASPVPPASASKAAEKRSGGGAKPRRTAEQRRRLTEARRAARDAERRLRAREEEAASADRAAQDAARRLTEAEEHLRDLREQTRRAQEEQRRARSGERGARERAREADRAVREARRRAESAARTEERTEERTAATAG